MDRNWEKFNRDRSHKMVGRKKSTVKNIKDWRMEVKGGTNNSSHQRKTLSGLRRGHEH